MRRDGRQGSGGNVGHLAVGCTPAGVAGPAVGGAEVAGAGGSVGHGHVGRTAGVTGTGVAFGASVVAGGHAGQAVGLAAGLHVVATAGVDQVGREGRAGPVWVAVRGGVSLLVRMGLLAGGRGR